ncbi:Yox1p NDAI_0C00850 [Naumovozyma dairenensis CBS 421]|uniref:Homeobox domain-containing protein n=1 Tax=Naumovozyma dairenensis (strain ATCC 10597 / BCRC 20456 / CBS 421 / NBRC 0211 / NRRL Y-12639) TaxID=1071378 RepID=G0W7I5_NAUDC|nr:hypothetical protein NDAI_0C00850 [Naumovozyma dairenensis CBS 421]CCD23746.1 hypothetical protein NDAI_0C00850 [Naumovozyma dairenensis CBS 421]
MFSNNNTKLPSVANLLNHEQATSNSKLYFPLPPTIRSNFQSDPRGIIKLPPILSSNCNSLIRPSSVESALRHTVSFPSSNFNPLPTPEDDNKNLLHQRIDPQNKNSDSYSSPLPHRLIHTSSFEPLSTKIKVPARSPSTPLIKRQSPTASSLLVISQAKKTNDTLTPIAAMKASITPSSNDKKRAFAFITHSKDTFGTKEPKIDNAPLARRKRRRTSSQELLILQTEFERCPTPNKKKRLELAEICKMSDKSVQIWFQNKRQSVKKQKLAIAGSNSTPSITSTASESLKLSDTSVNSSTEDFTEEDHHNNNTNTTPSVSNNENIPPLQLTPLAPKTSKDNQNGNRMGSTTTLKLRMPSSHSTPPRHNNKSSRTIITPTKGPSPNGKKSQALTFHLNNDKRILTPVKTSPNSRVNRLINGPQLITSPSKKNRNNLKLEFQPEFIEKSPLKEIDSNTIN